MPFGIDADGNEALEFIAGDVAVAPYPDWSQSDSVLASVTQLLRRLHDNSRRFDPSGLTWNAALRDPAGGTVVCHNDIELSNVVFREGRAVAFIDFEFAAPGRPLYDLAQLARLCVPIEDDFDQRRIGWTPANRPARLRLVADAYGLNRDGRNGLLATISDALWRVETTVRQGQRGADHHVAAAVEASGGLEKFDRRRRWWDTHHESFAAALS